MLFVASCTQGISGGISLQFWKAIVSHHCLLGLVYAFYLDLIY